MVPVAVYAADLWHPRCVVEQLVAVGELSPAAAWDMSPTTAIEQGASANALTEPWDSGEWPVLTVLTELPVDAGCAQCGDPIDE